MLVLLVERSWLLWGAGSGDLSALIGSCVGGCGPGEEVAVSELMIFICGSQRKKALLTCKADGAFRIVSLWMVYL